MSNHPRSQRILGAMYNCQSPAWRNEISPVKHELRTALQPFIERIRQIAQQAYLDEQSRSPAHAQENRLPS